MRFKSILVLTLIVFLFNGCLPKEYNKQKSALIIWKTPNFRYADMGFIYENDKSLKIEIYSSGQNTMTLNISNSHICMSLLECMSHEKFNSTVLSSIYPKDTLDNIFRGKKIFGGVGSNGSTQKISKAGEYNIKYQVFNNQIIFRDTINNILIKIKKQ